MPAPSCPTCKKPVRPRAENPAFPFCSPRCKQVDLGRWLSEEYRVPTDEQPDAGEPVPREKPGEKPQ